MAGTGARARRCAKRVAEQGPLVKLVEQREDCELLSCGHTGKLYPPPTLRNKPNGSTGDVYRHCFVCKDNNNTE